MQNTFDIDRFTGMLYGLLRQKRLVAAIKLSRMAVEFYPTHPASHFGLGRCLLIAGNQHGALEEMGAAIRLSSKDPALAFHRARIQFGLRRFSGSLSDAKDAAAWARARKDPTYLESSLLLSAAACAELGEPAEATGYLQQVAEDVVVHAGRLLTRELVLEMLVESELERKRGDRVTMFADTELACVCMLVSTIFGGLATGDSAPVRPCVCVATNPSALPC